MVELILTLLALFVTCVNCWILFKVIRFHAKRLAALHHVLRHTDYDYCTCGDSMDSHGFGSGHSPVSTRVYHLSTMPKLRIE